MKNFSLLFFSVAITSAFANSLNFPTVLKRELLSDREKFYDSVSEECVNEANNSEYFLDCMMVEATIDNYGEECSKVKSTKCQKFLNASDKTEYFPACKDSPLFFEIFQPFLIEEILLQCEVDENGELCPYAASKLTKTAEDDVMINTCKSKKCTEALHKVYNNDNMIKLGDLEKSSLTKGELSYQKLEAINKVIEILESDKCKSLHGSSSSDATAVKNSSILLLSSLILTILLNLI